MQSFGGGKMQEIHTRANSRIRKSAEFRYRKEHSGLGKEEIKIEL